MAWWRYQSKLNIRCILEQQRAKQSNDNLTWYLGKINFLTHEWHHVRGCNWLGKGVICREVMSWRCVKYSKVSMTGSYSNSDSLKYSTASKFGYIRLCSQHHVQQTIANCTISYEMSVHYFTVEMAQIHSKSAVSFKYAYPYKILT